MNSSPKSTTPGIRMCFYCLACAVVGVIVAELFLRLLIPYSIFNSTWYEAGIHQPSRELGFVLTPGYRGGMRHSDQTWYVPLELDENGCRLPMSSNQKRHGDDVVLLGGSSMVFCYGLTSSETIAAQIAQDSKTPITAHTLAWAGFDLLRDLSKYERFIEPRIQPGVVVVCLYDSQDYDDVHAPFESTLTRTNADLFRYHDSIVVSPNGRFTKSIGRPVYDSYVIGGICRQLDRIDEIIQRRIARWKSPHSDSSKQETREISVRRILNEHEGIDFITHLKDRTADYDAELLVVAIPHQSKQVGPVDLRSLVPKGIATLDLRDCLRDNRGDWKAQGHYGPRSAHIIGTRIAESLQHHFGGDH